jgi:hypothetical protein
MNEHLRGKHYLALLLDPRQHVREWVASQPSLVWSVATENRGSTEASQTAFECLQKTADTDVPDDDEWVKKLVAQGMHVIDAKEKWLENQLLAYLGLHPKLLLKHLGLSDKIFRQCIQSDSPLQFFEQRVGAQCVVRRAANRVFSCKPTSTPVERLWNVFGENLTVKRRSIGKGMLAELVYARMNMHLLPHDQLRDVAGGLEFGCFESLFEAACDLDEQHAVCEALAIRHALGRSVHPGEDTSNIDDGHEMGDTDEELDVLDLM